jgi:transcriptional regulator with GAF, ATPase, and Fis domain
MGKLAAMKERHLEEEGALLREALEANQWKLQGAADYLGVGLGSLQRVLGRHPDVEAERQKRMLERGGSTG